MSKCIVSFANTTGNYIRGLSRLVDSLKGNFDGQVLAFTDEASIGAPSHQENPYAFKVYVIERAIEAGYDEILYLDSSCFAIRNVQPIFDEIVKDGFFAQEAGHHVGTWCNDMTLERFGISRDEAMGMLMYGNAGMLGLNMMHENGNNFFVKWRGAMLDGCFKGAWDNRGLTESQDERCRGHRHDMSAGSIIANQMGLNKLYKKGNEWLQYAGVYDATANDTIIIKAQGV